MDAKHWNRCGSVFVSALARVSPVTTAILMLDAEMKIVLKVSHQTFDLPSIDHFVVPHMIYSS